jgi:hypothetical protein
MVTNLSVASVLLQSLHLLWIRSAVAESPIDGDQLRVGDGYNGTLTAAPLLHSSKRVLKRDFLSAAPAHAVCVKVARNHRLPWRVRPLRRLPALSSLPGQTVAHDAK